MPTLIALTLPPAAFVIEPTGGFADFVRGPFSATVPAGVTRVNVRFRTMVGFSGGTNFVRLTAEPKNLPPFENFCDETQDVRPLTCDFLLDVTPGEQLSVQFALRSNTALSVQAGMVLVQGL